MFVKLDNSISFESCVLFINTNDYLYTTPIHSIISQVGYSEGRVHPTLPCTFVKVERLFLIDLSQVKAYIKQVWKDTVLK